MDDAVISRIIQAAAALDPAEQGRFIAAEAAIGLAWGRHLLSGGRHG
jgi:hypothetical protein